MFGFFSGGKCCIVLVHFSHGDKCDCIFFGCLVFWPLTFAIQGYLLSKCYRVHKDAFHQIMHALQLTYIDIQTLVSRTRFGSGDSWALDFRLLMKIPQVSSVMTSISISLDLVFPSLDKRRFLVGIEKPIPICIDTSVQFCTSKLYGSANFYAPSDVIE